jgi:CRP-like cAMP-binding protein
MCIVHTKVSAGSVLWSKDKLPTFCFFLYSGEVSYTTMKKYSSRVSKIRPGYIVGDFPCLAGEAECMSEMTADTDLEILKIKKEDWLLFLGKNPGLMLLFTDEFIVD